MVLGPGQARDMPERAGTCLGSAAGGNRRRTAPVQGHISGVVDIPNACATLWLPNEIFDFDIMPGSDGPVKHLDGTVDIPLAPDL